MQPLSQKLTESEGEIDKSTILKGGFHALRSVTERTSRQKVCEDIDLNTTVTNETYFIRINHVLNYKTWILLKNTRYVNKHDDVLG